MAPENSQESAERCHTVKLKLGRLRLNFNPVVTFVAAILIWTFVAVCMAYPETSLDYMTQCRAWITRHFSWFYIGSVNAWIIFIIVVYFSKYGDMKLGKDDDQPEFSDASYFTMLFAAGIGVGFFYFGVAEPIRHYKPSTEYGNRYWQRYSDNQMSQDAINVTLYHWGLHGWIVYVLVGLALGIVSHRKNLPMTIRSCFYPIMGDRIYGFLGDFIDIVSIVSTMFGICASLGAGAMTMNAGLHLVDDSIAENTTNQTILIWVITFFATMSVITGLKLGIRRLSEICFILGLFIMFIILFYDDTFHLLNLFVQSIGYYLQNIIQLGFHTDAYAQLGNAPDEKESPDWMHNWTVSYWGWWISWSPFVGMFIAKISRGRTVKSFIRSTLFAPMLFTFMWFVVVGGSGINMERNAARNLVTCSSVLGGANSTEPAAGKLYRLSCRTHAQMYFDMIQQYGDGVSKFLRIISMLSILLYFVTSSDSGSLVIDCLSANGSPDPPLAQRIFWALTEGATATALLTAGGKRSLDAMLAAAVSSGLPYTPVLSLMCVSIWKVLKDEHGEVSHGKVFPVSLIEVADVPSSKNIMRVIISLVVPWLPAGHAAAKLYNKRPWRYMLVIALLFYGWVMLLIFQVVEPGLDIIGWVLLLGFFAYLAFLRRDMRERFGISGSIVEDGLAVFVFPLAVTQMDKHMSLEEKQKKDDPSREVIDMDEVIENGGKEEMTDERKSFVITHVTPEEQNWV